MLMLSGAGTNRMMETLNSKTSREKVHFQFSTGARTVLLFGRALVMGPLGLAWYQLCVKLELLQPSGLMPFVLFLEAVVPSAQNVVMLLLVHGDVSQGQAMAVSILEQYAVSIPFITLYLVYFIMQTQPFVLG